MTMVETLVAFTILIIISLSFLAIISFSSRITMEADDRRMVAQELDEKLARKNAGFTTVNWSIKLDPVGGGETITLPDCMVYSLTYPEGEDTEVTVLRFEYYSGE